MLKLLQYCNYIIIVMQIKLMLLLLLHTWEPLVLQFKALMVETFLAEVGWGAVTLYIYWGGCVCKPSFHTRSYLA